MLRYLLDTNICIFVGKADPTSDIAIRFKRASGSMAISTITLAELRFGVERSTRREINIAALDRLLDRLDVQPFDGAAASHYGAIRANLVERGTPIGSNDLFIAAHARSRGLTLVTNNLREFLRVPGLLVEDWPNKPEGA